MYQGDPVKVLTGEVRLSYAQLTQPRANQRGEERYSVTLLIPKTDVATKADIDASVQAAIQEAIGKVWNGVQPPVLNDIVHDGDGVRQRSGLPYGDECRGHWVLTASSKIKPQVVGIDNINVSLDPHDIYSGMYARVTIRFYGFAVNGNRGIACGLGNVLKTRDGEPLAGGASAAADFAGIGQAAGAAYQPSQPANTAGAAYQPAIGPSPQPRPAINPLTGQPYRA